MWHVDVRIRSRIDECRSLFHHSRSPHRTPPPPRFHSRALEAPPSLSLSLSCSPRGQTREVSALGRPPFNLCCSRNPRRPPSPVDLQAPRCVCIGHLCRPCCPPRSRPSLSSPRSRLVSETGRRASFREKLKIGHASAQLGLRGGGGIASAAARRTWVDGSRRGVGRGRCDRDRR